MLLVDMKANTAPGSLEVSEIFAVTMITQIDYWDFSNAIPL